MTIDGRTVRTPFGEVTLFADGSLAINATGVETHAWANRPGARWPCSTLSGYDVEAFFAPNGDLVDLEVLNAYDKPADIHGRELDAWAHDVRGEAFK